MDTAITIVTTVLDKKLVERVQRQRRGPKGHGLLCILRLLVLCNLARVFLVREATETLTETARDLAVIRLRTMSSSEQYCTMEKALQARTRGVHRAPRRQLPRQAQEHLDNP